MGFTIPRDDLDLFLKELKRVYVCSTYKNGSDIEALLKREGMKNLTTEQLKKANEKAVEKISQYFSYIWLADCQKCRKIIQDMEN